MVAFRRGKFISAVVTLERDRWMQRHVAVASFATAHHKQIQNRAIDNIGVEPVINAAAHDNHRAPVRFVNFSCQRAVLGVSSS